MTQIKDELGLVQVLILDISLLLRFTCTANKNENLCLNSILEGKNLFHTFIHCSIKTDFK